MSALSTQLNLIASQCLLEFGTKSSQKSHEKLEREKNLKTISA
jgi:hypothetical protein